ncbi:hypothetical protein ACOMCU_12710 [Lysinibacillus sp. UGB7]|uniref:hypothetical protein n=1 Tax=Lysinibacillus sp. UGB7 TaxID=3411039 RepID=UPI003B814974
MTRIVSFILLFLSAYTLSVQALDWAYPFVVWNGNVYEVKEEKVVESQIGKNIGAVKTRPNDMTGDYYGDASNAYSKGTKYFAMNDISTDTTIAVEVGDKQWQKAVYVHEAPFHWMDLFTKILPIAILISIVLIMVLRFKKRKKAT